MATKLQKVSELTRDTMNKLTYSIDGWLTFLDSAAWLYKYPWHEQVMIYAQRPDARACAPIELWNSPKFKRWVNRGAKGIALIDDSGATPALRYVFDISDTNTRYNIPFSLWQLKDGHEQQVFEELSNRFGEISEDSFSFADRLMGIIHNAVEDNAGDYANALLSSLAGSNLEEYDDANVQAWFEQLVELSAGYMTMTRLGLNAREYFEKQDYVAVLDFNSPAAISQLGTATADISEMVLRQIERSVRTIELDQRRTLAKKNDTVQNVDRKSERSHGYGTDIQTERGLPDSRYRDGRAADEEHRQIRDDEENIPEIPPQGDLQRAAADGQAGRTALGDGRLGEDAGRADGDADGESGRRDRGAEIHQSDEMGGLDEQLPALGGGSSLDGADLQLTPQEPEPQANGDWMAEGVPVVQLNLTETDLAGSEQLPAFVSGELILPMLKKAYYTKDHKPENIEGFFYTHHDEAERTEFIKAAFDDAYCEVLVDEHRVGYKKYADGLLVWDGAYLSRTAESKFSWDIVVSLIGELIEKHEFVQGEIKPMFPSENDQLTLIEQAEEQTSAFSVSQADFDNELCRGSGFSKGKLRIYTFYQSQPSTDSAVKFLKDEYGIGGHSHTYLDGSSGFVDHDGKGISFADGHFQNKQLFKWNAVHKRLTELIALDRYLTEKEKAYLPTFEQEQMERRLQQMEATAAREALRLAAAAMDERRKDALYRFSLGDEVQLGAQTYTILGYDEETVMLSDPKYPLLSEDMPRDIFERRLRENPQNDHLIVESAAEQAAEETLPAEEESPYVYTVGDTVYIDNTAFNITEIGINDVQLLDPTLIYPIFRAENRETFHHLLEQDERNAAFYPTMTQRTVTEPNLREEPPEEESQPELPSASETLSETTVAFYPAEKNKLPFDIEIRTLKTAPKQEKTPKHDFHITDDNLGHGGAKTKFRMNMDAINTLQTVELENRLATPEEQTILSRYVGWGGIPQAFEEGNDAWTSEYEELRAALPTEEYEAARASTLNAHYTSPVVIKAMYQCIENMGFRTGNVLEPSCGIGNFFGLLPESMSSSKLYGIELDPITGRIAKQLYQSANIAIEGFEDTSLPDSFFDLAIGNVPFGNYGVADKRYDKNHFHIHDYFFAKTLDKVRPGGVVAFITSSYTMDKKSPEVRKYLAERAELLGAIRLPNNAFLANAGTGVLTDILFLQKRDRPVAIEPEWVHLGKTEQGYAINQYFVDNPDMVLGELAEESTQYGRQECTVRPIPPIPGADLSEQLADAIMGIHGNISEYEHEEEYSEMTDESIPADPDVRNFSFALVDGDIYYRENSRMNKMDVSVTAQNRIKGMIEIRDCTRRLIEYQLEGYSDETISREQQNLNILYDEYTKKYGLLNSRGNKLAFADDSSYPLLCSLEEIDEHGNLKRKADMFFKRTIRQRQEIDHADTASEALALSIGEKAKVDMAYMAELTGKTEEQLFDELKGVIFLTPMYGYSGREQEKYLPADEYLSGNVREKLEWAKSSAALHPEDYAVNVEALERVQPKDLTASEIDVRLGASWLPADVIRQFIFELLNPSSYARGKVKVHHSKYTETWNIEGKSADYDNVAANVTYGTKRINAYKIIEETLNLKDVRIFDTKIDASGNEIRVLNQNETILAQQKQQAIKDKFNEWIWRDADRRDELTKLYNEKFNSTRPREYDGSHIRFHGMNPEIQLRPHQVNAVARTLYGGNTLLGHVVGAGKTFEMTAAAMESKRLGLCEKSLFVVPNHLTEQWASEFLQLYPAANILVATRKDFETHNRKRFCSRIATGDYDAIIIGHSQFEKIPLSRERQAVILQEQIDEITEGIREAKAERAERFTVKQMEKMKKNLKLKLDKLNDQSRKDDVITYEELGVDRLFVDEAHFYKNLFLTTKMRNVAGLAQTEAQKSTDLFMKCRYMDELTDGKGIVFATGTPISNSMTEMYTMQRYLQYSLLQEKGLTHFDAWASTFGETVTAVELAPEGTGYRAKTRFARFYNLPELICMFKEVADIQTSDMLDLPVPDVEYKNITLQPSDYQKDIVSSLADRAELVRKGSVDPRADNMLRITNDGRKLALDQRLVNGMLPDNAESKTNICADNIYDIWENGQDKALTQLVFCDLSTPHPVKAEENGDEIPPPVQFRDVYTDLKEKLIQKGIPDYEIAFIHDAKTEVQKSALFSKVRAGQVRVLIGSTFKMGAGTNVQRKLVALHHLDIPWRPSDIEQREGRMIRQGNENTNVEVYRYVTKGTFDAYMWQTIENKQKFISQIMTSKSPVRSCEDIDEQALSYAEVKALAVDNPYIMEKMTLDIEVAKLKLLKSNYLSQKYSLEDKLVKHYPKEIRLLQERQTALEADIALYEQHKTEEFPGMTLQGKHFAEKKDAGAELIGICKTQTSPAEREIGEYKGFKLLLSYDILGKVFRLTLKGATSHTIEVGVDGLGNVQRMDNALEKLPDRLSACKKTIEETAMQMEAAKAEIAKPFEQEVELAEKTERLAALDALLSLDKRQSESIDTLPEEQEEERLPPCVDMER